MIIIVLLLGALLLYVLQRILYKKLWNRKLSLTVSFNSQSAFEGEHGSITEILENRSFLPLPFVHAKFRIGSGLVFENSENVSTSDQNYKNDIFAILFYQRIRRTLEFSCEKRGYYAIHAADLVSTDLFYTSHMVCEYPQNTSFCVYPRRVDVSRFEQPLKKMIGELASRAFLYPDPFEFRGLRDYTISDPMNTINWKASAKAGSLMVNQYNSTTSRKIVILLNTEDELVIHHGPLHEDAIRIASTLAAHLLAQGNPVRFVTNGRDLSTREVPKPINANGTAAADSIFRMLARINTDLPAEEFFPYIKAEMEDPDYVNAGYILISASMKQPLQDAFSQLSNEAVCLWIIPLYNNMESHIREDLNAEVLRWEVEGHA